MSDSKRRPARAKKRDKAALVDGDQVPTFDELAADPEIAALLKFVPVPRDTSPPGAWTPALQREFIARLANVGSQSKACGVMSKDRGGATKLYNAPDGASFRQSWHAAKDLFLQRRRAGARDGPPPMRVPPTVDGRRKFMPDVDDDHDDDRGNLPQPGQRLNHLGEWEDAASIERRGEEAADSIRGKLLRCRRIYLCSIAGDAGKRAAFEILTELPIDWDLAAKMQPQPDEPWRPTNQRDPDWVLTADSGWSFGEIGYGPDKMAEARGIIDRLRAEKGEEPIAWSGK